MTTASALWAFWWEDQTLPPFVPPLLSRFRWGSDSFRWSFQNPDLTFSVGGGTADGIVTDGTTIWAVDRAGSRATAFDYATRARDTSRDIALASGRWEGSAYSPANDALWFMNNDTNMAVAYTASTRARNAGLDIAPPANNYRGLMADDTHLWLVRPRDAIAYTISTQAADPTRDFVFGFSGGFGQGGAYLNGILYALGGTTAFAFDETALTALPAADVPLLSGAWRGITAWDNTMWAVDPIRDTASAYHLSENSVDVLGWR